MENNPFLSPTLSSSLPCAARKQFYRIPDLLSSLSSAHSQAEHWGRRHRKCKGSVAGTSWGWVSNSRENSVDREERIREMGRLCWALRALGGFRILLHQWEDLVQRCDKCWLSFRGISLAAQWSHEGAGVRCLGKQHFYRQISISHGARASLRDSFFSSTRGSQLWGGLARGVGMGRKQVPEDME